jgi:hypothetical protein
MKRNATLFLFLMALVFTSCYDLEDFEDFRIKPFKQTWAFPILNSTITFRELVERSETNTSVGVLPGSTLYFMSFRDTLIFSRASDQYALSSQLFSSSIGVPGGLPPVFPTGAQVSHSETVNQTFSAIPGVELKSIDYSSGSVTLRLQNNFQHAIAGQLIVTSLENSSGTPVSIPFSLGGIGSNLSNERLLDPLVLNLHNIGAGTYNSFRFSVNFTITSSGNPNLSGNLGVEIEFNSPDYFSFSGKVNGLLSSGEHEYPIAVFNSTVLASQHFAQPSISYTILNGYGIPVSIGFSQFEAKNNAGSIMPVVNEGVLTPTDLNLSGENVLNYITDVNQSYASTPLALTYQNSNIEDIFDIAPNKILYESSVTLGDNTDNHDFFVKKSSSITFLSDISVPLTGWATTHLLSDTLTGIEFPEVGSMGVVDSLDYSVTLKFKFNNELPLSMELQIQFLDDADVLLEQLFPDGEQQLVESAPVDANGESTGSTSKYTLVELDREKYERLLTSTKMILFYRMSTGGTTQQNIRVLSTNKVRVQMSAIISATIDPQSL